MTGSRCNVCGTSLPSFYLRTFEFVFLSLIGKTIPNGNPAIVRHCQSGPHSDWAPLFWSPILEQQQGPELAGAGQVWVPVALPGGKHWAVLLGNRDRAGWTGTEDLPAPGQ